jgi:hypothetical protein
MRTKLVACWLLLLFGSLVPSAQAQQALKPVFVMAIAPVDDLLKDSDYLCEVFGAKDSAKMVRQVIGPYLGGIDRKRPLGAYALANDAEPIVVGFIPVTSLKVELTILEDTLGKAEELDDGVFKIAVPEGVGDDSTPKEVFLKEQGGWAFYSDKLEHLVNLPKDPVALLGGLEKKYDIGMRIVFDNVSAEDRQKFVEEMKKQFEMARAMPEGEDKVPEEFTRSMEETFLKYAEGTRSLDYGFNVDATNRNVALALAVEPIAGSELAKSLASAQTLTSSHSGILVQGAAVLMHRAAKLSPDDVATWNVFLDQMIKEAREKNPMPAENEAMQADGAKLMERIAKATYADGNVEWGTSYVISKDNKLTVIGGIRATDVKGLEADVRAFVTKYKTELELDKGKFEWDFAKHGNVRIIKITPPKDPTFDASLIGDDPSLYFGIDGDFVYVTLGNDALAQLKAAIDLSAKRPTIKAAPFRLRVDVTPFVKMAADKLEAHSPLVDSIIAKLEKSADKSGISANLLARDGGLEGRLEIDESVLAAAPEVGQLIMQTIMKAYEPMMDPALPQF